MFLAGIQACADGRWIPDKLVLVKTGKHAGMTNLSSRKWGMGSA